MEKESKKPKIIETSRWIWYKVVEDKKWKKVAIPWISENIDRLSIQTHDSSEYSPSKDYLQDIQVEIVWIKWNDETLMSFIKSI